jgi:Tfp pilus assembly protein PilX
MDGNASRLLKQRRPSPGALRRAGQQGMVLLMALVVLVVIMVAGIAMMRSVDTATLVAGNLAFQQAATNAADKGIEAAIQMLQQKQSDKTLDSNDPGNGYSATLHPTDNPAAGQSWADLWNASLGAQSYFVGQDQFNNKIWFAVNRECINAAAPAAGGQCVASPKIAKASGNSEEAGDIQITAASQVYYRITVRVQGPRRTESYVQSHIAM